MKLYRGTRHTSGRVDVIVSHAGGETWLREARDLPRRNLKDYSWGDRSDATRRLAFDLLADATGSPTLAELLSHALFEHWLTGIPADHVAFASWEIEHWVIDELYAMLMEERSKPKGGTVPCPSEN